MDLDWATVQNPERQWQERRKTTVGSSDIPIILGLSPYKTPIELWEIKTGLVEPQAQNFAMKRGVDMEPVARDWFNTRLMLKFEPKFFTHPDVPMFTANLDGWHEQSKQAVEIKFSGEKDHSTAKSGKVPDHYLAQVHWQYIVTRAVNIYYLSYQPNDSIIIQVPKPTEDEAQRLMFSAAEFMELVRVKIKPKPTERDVQEIEDPALIELAKNYKIEMELASEHEKKAESIKALLIESAKNIGHKRIKIAHCSITKATRQGTVDYSKVPSLNGIDLDQYRKPSTEYYTVKVDNVQD